MEIIITATPPTASTTTPSFLPLPALSLSSASSLLIIIIIIIIPFIPPTLTFSLIIIPSRTPTPPPPPLALPERAAPPEFCPTFQGLAWALEALSVTFTRIVLIRVLGLLIR